MNERIIAVTLTQTGNATTAAWVVEFPFPTKLLGVKASGSAAATSTLTIAGGAVMAATEIGDGDPSYLEPTTTPDYIAADTAITFTLTQSGSPHDDPCLIAFFLVGEGGTNLCGPGEALICVTVAQTGDATDADWCLEFPFPVRLIGIKACGSQGSIDSTIELADGAVMAATAIASSGNPTWYTPTTTPDYVAADTVITLSLAQVTTRADDPLILIFFAVGEGGTTWKGMSDRTICTTLLQTGNCTTGAWIFEFPFPVRYMGAKTSGSNSATSTLTVAGGAVDAAAELGDSGDPNYLQPTTEPDYVAKDTAVTVTLTQSGSRHDDPMVLMFWEVGEG